VRANDIVDWTRGPALEAILIVLGALLLTRAVRASIGHVASRRDSLADLPEQVRYRRSVVMAITRTAIGLLWFAAGLLVIDRMRLPVATLVAPATVVGAALGFGAQRLVSDFLSGFFLIAERQLGYGDVVEICAPGSSTWMKGTVEEVTLRYTRLRTPTGGVLTVSNADVRQVLNRSRDWSRVDITVPVPASSDIDQVAADLRDSLRGLATEERWEAKLLSEPAVAGVESLDLTQVDLRVSARTVPTAVDEVARELRRRAAVVTTGGADA
jgi:small conductance mechanosensitive channel